jgi:putative oxidoreductase
MFDKWMNPYKDWANFILRSLVGFIFLAHGAQKLYGVFGGPGLAGAGRMFEQFGFVPGEQWAWAVGTVELVGGTALLIGLLTRYAALLLSVLMSGAMIVVHLPNGFFLPNGIEFVFALLAANLALLVGGPGELAVDGWLARHGMFKGQTPKDVPVRRAA